MELQNLKDIFKGSIFRIPDYQRGYAWRKPHVQDFWEDLISLAENRMHYTGLITLQPVKAEALKVRIDGASWLESENKQKFYYVVDGQQRLTTFVILIQAILDKVKDSSLSSEIEETFLKIKVNNSQINICYKFGYDSDEASQDFLIKEIFKDKNYLFKDNSVTAYTKNITDAYSFFTEKISTYIKIDNNDDPQKKLIEIYTKLTNNILFNVFETTTEIDIFVTFETMNNRGKSLTNLELLKNRLIYLTSLFDENSEKNTVREYINRAWKSIYSYLGRNPNNVQDDDVFLKNHWIMYFTYNRSKGDAYIQDLLNIQFSRNSDREGLLEKIQEYVSSLQQSVKCWFILHNPKFDNSKSENSLSETHKEYLDRLTRLGYKSFRPLLLAALLQKSNTTNKINEPSVLPTDEQISQLLASCERYNFLTFNISQRRSNTGDSRFYKFAREIFLKENTVEDAIKEINNWTEKYYSSSKFMEYIADKYKYGRLGFYNWDGLHYFLYEYNLYLNTQGKQSGLDDLPDWTQFIERNKNNETIEHIYPQNPEKNPKCSCNPLCESTCKNSWITWYKDFDEQQKIILLHSLGNLVPMSRSKNSSLKNSEFHLKNKSVKNGQAVGFFNGSAAENEIAQELTWQAQQILKRGIELLNFLEERWNTPKKMDDNVKTKILQLDFVTSIDTPQKEPKS